MQSARKSPTPAHEMDMLAYEVSHLLANHSVLLEDEGVRKQTERLKSWLDSRCAKGAAEGVLPQDCAAWLSDLRDRIKLAAEEKQRLEGEGGMPASKEQAQKLEELFALVHRIDEILAHEAESHH